MIIEDTAPYKQYQILATDLDIAALAKAREGQYLDSDVKNVPSKYIPKYLTARTDGVVKVDESLKRHIKFTQHNLLSDPFTGQYDLIVCRNVVIYFTDDAKEKLYARFANSLKTGGMLFVGGTEIIRNSRGVGLEPFIPFVYIKTT
jgi:chemotaxis protein methyltransferase CheR